MVYIQYTHKTISNKDLLTFDPNYAYLFEDTTDFHTAALQINLLH